MMIRSYKASKNKGFTIIELMIVIAVIGILASVAIPNFLSYRIRAYNASANSDAKNLYNAAQAYFSDYASGQVDLDLCKDYGFQQTQDVYIYVSKFSNRQNALYMYTKHLKGDKYYLVYTSGHIYRWPN